MESWQVDEPRTAPHAAPFRALRVLVVEDEMLIRWSIVETLEQAGHHVAEAATAAAAVRLLSAAAEPFDVVLLDFRLPDSNDLQLLAAVRRLSPHSAAVLMTAFGTEDVVSGALRLGAYRVLSKPFEMQDLSGLLLDASQAALPR